jgi:hypothetical protein
MKKTVITFLLIALVTASGLYAEKIGGVDLPDTIKAGDTRLELNGGGTRMKFIIKVYVGGLYLQASSSDAETIIEADEPMAIWLQFVRDVDKKSIVDAWNQGFENSASDGYTTAQRKIDSFNGVFASDVEKHGVYEIVYVPGEGTTVSINGEQKASISGFDFKQAVFAIWLGSQPADENLKKGMLAE